MPKKLNKQKTFFSWLNKLKKQTDLKGQHNFLLLFIFGGSCRLSIVKQCSGDLTVL